jgi:predicted amidophosphoribosyltransferase
VGEINIVSGGYVVCPSCSSKLTRFGRLCPRCGNALPESYVIQRNGGHRLGLSRLLRSLAAQAGHVAAVIRR